MTSGLRELFRYRKEGRIRSYALREISDHEVELWVVAETGRERKSRKLTTFTNEAETLPFLEDVEKELRSGGWMNVSR
jgi:hypothetical protein